MPDPVRTRDVFLGLGLLLVCHLAAAVFTGGIGLVLIGLTQLAYVIPGAIVARSKQRKGIAIGLVLGAALTFLLNAACFGVVLFSLRS